MDDTLDFVFAPISGGYFVSQAAILSMFKEARNSSASLKLEPDAYMGASGGAIASVLALVSDKTVYNMRSIVGLLRPSLFIKSWWATGFKFIPSFLLALFKTAIYDDGIGTLEIVNDFFSKTKLEQGPEVWILAFDKNGRSGDLFCTKDSDKAMFEVDSFFKGSESGLGRIIYIGSENKNMLNKALEATSCIPGIKAGVTIKVEDEKVTYIDGGISGATPLRFFSNSILEKSQGKKLHLFYILPNNIFDDAVRNRSIRKKEGVGDTVSEKHWVSDLFEVLHSLNLANMLQEIEILFLTFMRKVNKAREELVMEQLDNLTVLQLRDLMEINDDTEYLMIAWSDEAFVKIASFTKEQLQTEFDKAVNSLHVRIYT